MRTRIAALIGAVVLALAACSQGGTGTAPSGTDPDAALSKGGKLLVWSWEPTLKNVVTKFEAGPRTESDHLPVIAEIGWRD